MKKAYEPIKDTRSLFEKIEHLYTTNSGGIYKSFDLYIKNYLKFTGDRGADIEDWRANISLGITQTAVDTIFSHIYDNYISFSVDGRNVEDDKKAKITKEYLDHTFDASGSRPVLFDVIKDTITLGTGFAKIGYRSTEDKVEYKTPYGKKKHTILKESTPYISRVSPYNIIIDGNASSLENARFVVERKIIPVEKLNSVYGIYIKKDLAGLKAIQEKGTPLSYEDKEGIKRSILHKNVAEYQDYQDYDVQYVMTNKTMEVLEYWTDNEFKLFYNGKLVYEGVNPLPIKKKPYVSMAFVPVVGSPYGIGVGHLVMDYEDMTNSIFNMDLDRQILATMPIFQRVRGASSDMYDDISDTLELTPMKVYDVSVKDGITPIQMGGGDSGAMGAVGNIKGFISEVLGLNDYATGAEGKVERSATGVEAKINAFNARLKPFFDTLNRAMSDIAKIWIAEAIAYSEGEIDVRVFDKEGRKEFKKIKVEDLIGQFDISFEAQGMHSIAKEIKREKITEIMDTLSNMMDNDDKPAINRDVLNQLYVETNDLPQELLFTKEQKEEKTKELEEGAGEGFNNEIDAASAEVDMGATAPTPVDMPVEAPIEIPTEAPIIEDETQLDVSEETSANIDEIVELANSI